MLLVDEFITLNMSETFKEMFFVVIQLGAILAVVGIFWNKMFPFQFKDKENPIIKMDIISLWFKVVVACIPGAIVTILFDDYIEAHLHTPIVIAIALIFYGIAFILIEEWNKKRTSTVVNLSDITYQTALMIGLFQVLSIIPGTSRSGATIIGALLIGVSRVAAAEFTFFLAVPVMFGLSAIKIIKFGFSFTSTELLVLGIGMAVAFMVSVIVIKFLMEYIKRHDFKLFGWYRIMLGILVLLYFVFLDNVMFL
jgi:undecaprenyl-diphosphatase